MQHLDSWGEDDHEKVPKQPKTARKELINDLETVGTSVTRETIGDTLCCNGLKSCSIQKVSILHKAHVQARLRVASKHDSEKALVKVLWLVENDIELFGISSACWEGLSMNQRTRSLQSSTEVETLCFWLFNANTLRSQRTGACMVKSYLSYILQL